MILAVQYESKFGKTVVLSTLSILAISLLALLFDRFRRRV